MKLLIFFCALVLLSAVSARHKHEKKKHQSECMWHDFMRHDNVNSWEFQTQPHRRMVENRDRAIAGVEKVLQQLTDDPDSGVQFVPDTRYMAIFREVMFQTSSRHGHPLHPDPDKPKETPFPWQGLSYLRLRQYRLLTPAGAYVPTAMPGMADLTFKAKCVDPEQRLGALEVPEKVGAAKVTAKLEQDIHCDHARTTMSPLYKPVSTDVNISKIANVRDYFPNLAQVARLSEDEVLPFMHEVHRAKIMWTVVFKGMVGEANLVIKYDTNFEDAVAGANAKNGEISLRIRRKVAEATGTPGEEGSKKLYAALDALADAMQVFRDKGWDGKTPSLPKGKSGEGGGCSCGSSSDGDGTAPHWGGSEHKDDVNFDDLEEWGEHDFIEE